MNSAYEHGGACFPQGGVQAAGITDFSVNINPLGMPPAVWEALHRAVDACIHYPDPFASGLRAALAERYAVSETQVFCGNGAADVIERLAEVLKPKRALLLAPSFSEYERALTRRGCHCAFHVLRREEGFQLTERVLDDLNEETELFWLCLPNNPTGLVPSEELFLRILSRCAEMNITLITDECFFGFLNRDNAPSLRHHLRAEGKRERRILLGAFTKTFAMPGVRLGYCVSSDPALGEALFAAGQPWPVSVLAEAAGEAALASPDWERESAAKIAVWRAELAVGLRALGLWVSESESNFLLVSDAVPNAAKNAARLRFAAACGLPLRDCANFRGLSAGYFRTAVKTTEENQRLLSALADFEKEGEWQRQS